MIRLQINISDTARGTVTDTQIGHAEKFTLREKEIADSIADKFKAEFKSIKHGSVLIIEKENKLKD